MIDIYGLAVAHLSRTAFGERDRCAAARRTPIRQRRAARLLRWLLALRVPTALPELAPRRTSHRTP